MRSEIEIDEAAKSGAGSGSRRRLSAVCLPWLAQQQHHSITADGRLLLHGGCCWLTAPHWRPWLVCYSRS
eukprot:COSAG01_NODE_1410_length_10411_cov_7.944337_11_plen_70_part_00